MFSKGREVSVLTDSGQRLVFTVERPFTPFTKSVVLLARCKELSSEPVIVKIFDPRFLDERALPQNIARPWSFSAESAAPATYNEDDLWQDEPASDDIPGQVARASLWEAHFRSLLMEAYESERGAYVRLQHLQGSAIPRLIANGLFVPPDERAFQPPVLVLEYVEGTLLADTPVQALTPELCTTLVGAIDSFAAYGVIHNDINLNNVIVAPGRTVVIDFGCAALRQSDQDDEHWVFNVNFGNDGGRIRLWLREKGVLGMDDLLRSRRE
ncbi:hypothetical protein HDZ31DRAFT_80551 [Schizophyllum fasciatum]